MGERSKYRGCLLGGAAGDALGYAVEFMNESAIWRRFGDSGITAYELIDDAARFSDDTQMTLFTAVGLLLGEDAGLSGPDGPWIDYILAAYYDWMRTQDGTSPGANCWLNNVPELNARRAPGTTCTSYLRPSRTGTVANPQNDSKGCGGVMRVAPIGLYFNVSSEKERLAVDMIGAEAAALTHGHELGWMSASMLVHMIQLLAHNEDVDVAQAAAASCDAMEALFPNARHLGEMIGIVQDAMTLAQAADITDVEAIHELGEGWVGEEALAIAVYCAMRHEQDFQAALIAAVNHNGDSDSTGAVAGNILGARLGVEAIPDEYIDDLEIAGVLTEVADDLLDGKEAAKNWNEKYVAHTYTGKSG